jgi:hypothetical protein
LWTADVAALIEVLEDDQGFFLREMAVEHGGALALEEAVYAGIAAQQADVALLAVAGAWRSCRHSSGRRGCIGDSGSRIARGSTCVGLIRAEGIRGNQ